MPPIASQEHQIEESAHLSNEAVQLLDSIVRRAQERIDAGARTFDALFSAYESVFSENGLDSSQDKVCFRTILRLGQPSGDGLWLYDRFEGLLAEQNIVLEFDNDSAQPDVEETRSDSGADMLRDGPLHQEEDLRPSRRASFTSVYDTTKELARLPAPRASSRSSVSRLGLEGAKVRMSDMSKDLVGNHASTSRQKHLSSGNRRPPGKDFEGRPPFHGPPEGTAMGPRHHPKQHRHRETKITDSYHQIPQTRPSKAELMEKANAFKAVRLKFTMRKIILEWAAHALETRSNHGSMELRALANDRLTLLRQAFDIWHTTYRQRRHRADTERYYEHQYVRSGKARDLYLLAKAFSHWRVISAEEAARTSVARRHILRTKYFNAWKDITVINELKAQRQGLKRPFNLLRQRFAQICTNEVNAISVYHHNLTKVVFFRWFWGFCEAAVPRYRISQVQTKIFKTWVDRSKQRAQQERQADSFFLHKSIQKITINWATAARIDVGGYHQADSYRNRRLLTPLLREWQTEAKLSPLLARVSNMRDWRIARKFFTVWVLRNRMTSKAKEVESLRLKRNTWTAWNDELRVRAVQSQSNDRVVIQSLYKWVLRERFLLMSRIHEQNVKREIFTTLLRNVRAKNGLLDQRESSLSQFQTSKTLSSTLETWQLRMKLIRQHGMMATEYLAPRLEHDTLSAWRSTFQTIRKYQNQAELAHFYFRTKRVLQRWSFVTREAQKKRRQAAYGAIRKLVKTHLVRRALESWHDRLEHVDSLQEEGQNVADARLREELSLIFVAWRTSTVQRLENVENASENHQVRLLRGTLGNWQDATRGYDNLRGRALHFHHIHVSEICSSQLRKLSLKAFEIRCREQAADATKERHFDKHLRRMFKHWNERTRVKMLEGLTEVAATLDVLDPEERHQQQTPPAPERSFTFTRSELDTRRAEEWTAFEEELDYGNNNEDWIPPLDEASVIGVNVGASATPGYLNTPSKRAVRARALATLSTTPAGTPAIRTPFTTRLRGETRTPGTIERERTARKVTFEDQSN